LVGEEQHRVLVEGRADLGPRAVVERPGDVGAVDPCREAGGERGHGERHRGHFAQTAFSSLLGAVSRTHVKVPRSAISRAPRRNAAMARRESAPPTLMRLTPASASCARLRSGSAALITTFIGLLTDDTATRIVARSRTPGQ